MYKLLDWDRFLSKSEAQSLQWQAAPSTDNCMKSFSDYAQSMCRSLGRRVSSVILGKGIEAEPLACR